MSPLPDEAAILARLTALIAPFNKKSIAIAAASTFATDLELDSLAVMDLVAEIEDEFDITLPLNLLPDLETVGDVGAAVGDILRKGQA